MTLIIVVECSIVIEKSPDNLYFEIDSDDNMMNKIKFIMLSSFLTCSEFIIYFKNEKYYFNKADILELFNLRLEQTNSSTITTQLDVHNLIYNCLPIGKIFEYIKNKDIISIFKKIKLKDTELDDEILITDFFDKKLYSNYKFIIYLTFDENDNLNNNYTLIEKFMFENLFICCYSGSAVPSKI